MTKIRHRSKRRGDWSNCYRDIAIFRFSRWRLSAILDLKKFENLTADTVEMIKLRHPTKFRGDRSNLYRDSAIFHLFQYGGYLPSWVCYARVWTIYEEYFVVFIVVQNLVGIRVVVLIICMLMFSPVWLGNAYSRGKMAFGGFYLLNGRYIKETPKRHIIWWKYALSHMYRHATFARDEVIRKERQRKNQEPCSGKLGILRDHPRCGIEMKFCTVGGLRVEVLRLSFIRIG